MRFWRVIVRGAAIAPLLLGYAQHVFAQAGGGGAAPTNSPAFTGTPTAPTATVGTNTTQIATTAFVANAQVQTFGTATNCSSSASPAVCDSAASGSAAVPTGSNPTLLVNTTAVTANSQVLVTPDESLGTKLGVTCNSTITTVGPITVTARSPGVSFTVQVDATVAVNPVCFSYTVIN